MLMYAIMNKQGDFYAMDTSGDYFVNYLPSAYLFVKKEIAEMHITASNFKDCKAVEVTIVLGDLDSSLKEAADSKEKLIYWHNAANKSLGEKEALKRNLDNIVNDFKNLYNSRIVVMDDTPMPEIQPVSTKFYTEEALDEFAIKELENVLKTCFIGKCKTHYDVDKDMYVPSERDKAIIDFIENRIAELKGKK